MRRSEHIAALLRPLTRSIDPEGCELAELLNPIAPPLPPVRRVVVRRDRPGRPFAA